MSEKYKRVLSIDTPKWYERSPVLFQKGALLFDIIQNKNILQLQFKNLSHKEIKAIKINIECIDIIDNKTIENVAFIYLDLDVKANCTFGSDTPILLNAAGSREFKIIINKVIFADDSAEELNIELQNIAMSQETSKLGNLSNQFLKEIKNAYPSIKCISIPTQYDDYWYCICGAFNVKINEKCSVCQSEIEILMSLSNIDDLKAKYEKAENYRIEVSRIGQLKKKKLIIGAVSLLLFIFVCVAVGIRVQNAMEYKNAESLIKQGKYDEAILVLEENDGKNSKKLLIEAKYQKGIFKLSNEDYEAANIIFSELGEYKDSNVNLKVCKEALELINSNQAEADIEKTNIKIDGAPLNFNNEENVKATNIQPVADGMDTKSFINFLEGHWGQSNPDGFIDNILFSKINDSHINFDETYPTDQYQSRSEYKNMYIWKLADSTNDYRCETWFYGESYDLYEQFTISFVNENTIILRRATAAYDHPDEIKRGIANFSETYIRQ